LSFKQGSHVDFIRNFKGKETTQYLFNLLCKTTSAHIFTSENASERKRVEAKYIYLLMDELEYCKIKV
jgi:hypothetical protein